MILYDIEDNEFDTAKFDNFIPLTKEQAIAMPLEELRKLADELDKDWMFLQDVPAPSDRPLIEGCDVEVFEADRVMALISDTLSIADDIAYKREQIRELELQANDLSSLKESNDALQSKHHPHKRQWHCHESIDDIIHARLGAIETEIEKIQMEIESYVPQPFDAS